jgi:hypothetical protein
MAGAESSREATNLYLLQLFFFFFGKLQALSIVPEEASVAAGWVLPSGHQRVTPGREALAYSMLSFLSMKPARRQSCEVGISMLL